MFINKLELTNFRNFSNSIINFSKGINTIYGNNGQGKTNLIESLYLLTKNRNFRKVKRENLIKYEEEIAIIKGQIDSNTIKVVINKEEKKNYLNDKQNYKNEKIIDTYLLNSDFLFYFKNFSNYRIKTIDKLCYNIYKSDFLNSYKKYISAAINLKIDSNNKIWFKIYKNYQEKVDSFRINLFKTVKEKYDEYKEEMLINDVVINFIRGNKKEINILRKDKKDLSLGELKAVIFAIVSAVATLDEKKETIFLFDDFNSEWDKNKQKKAMDILEKSYEQSFVMLTEKSFNANYYIEKGEIHAL